MVRLIPVLPAFFVTSAALADDWKEYANRAYSFTVDFPGTPAVEATTYGTSDGRSFPAHVFSVKQKTGEFKVTVVEVPGEQMGPDAGVMKEATKVLAAGGTIQFDSAPRARDLRPAARHRGSEWRLFLRRAVLPE
jgi:hypothetical protein